MNTLRLSRLAAVLGTVTIGLAALLGGLGASAALSALPAFPSSGQALEASAVPSISNILGATFDPARGEVIVFGIADPALPGLEPAFVRDNLIVALRAYYHSTLPEVPGASIEGELDPLSVVYFGGVNDTQYGRVAFEADRLLKTYSMGRDNLTGLTVTSAVTGYQSYPARMQRLTETVADPILIRYFYTPTLLVEPITSPHTILFSQTHKLVDWAYLSEATSPASAQAAQGFVDNFNRYYLEYAAERRAARGDTTLYEMAQLSKLTAIAQWAAEYEHGWEKNVPGLNAPWLEHLPQPVTTTVTQTSGITVTWVQTITGEPREMTLRGGVYGVGRLQLITPTAQGQALAGEVHRYYHPPLLPPMTYWIRDNWVHPFGAQDAPGAPAYLTRGPVVGYVVSIADNALVNGDFEQGPGVGWLEKSNRDYELIVPDVPYHGIYGAWLAGYDDADETLSQTLTIPADATRARLTYWRAVVTDEPAHPRDFMACFLADSRGRRLKTLETLTDANEGYWQQASFDVISYTGQTVQLWFTAMTDSANPTWFYVDDVSLDYLDMTPPAVVTVTHAPASVPLSAPVEFTVTFREPLRTAVVPTVTLHLHGGQTHYPLTPQAGASYTQGYPVNTPAQWHGLYTFTAQMPDGVYNVDVSGAQDLAGNVMFPAMNVYTLALSTRLPAVLDRFPAGGAKMVATNAGVVITFSEAINAGTLSYALSPDPGGWTSNWDSTRQVVTLSHSPWAARTAYTVTVTQARDLAGNPLDGAPVMWSFTTRGEVYLPIVIK